MAIFSPLVRYGLMALGLAGAATAVPAQAQTTIKAVMNSDLKILDPIWTTAYITRNHGFQIYIDQLGSTLAVCIDRISSQFRAS